MTSHQSFTVDESSLLVLEQNMAEENELLAPQNKCITPNLMIEVQRDLGFERRSAQWRFELTAPWAKTDEGVKFAEDLTWAASRLQQCKQPGCWSVPESLMQTQDEL